MLLDKDGREIVRRKQLGFLRGPVEYILADPSPADVDLCDCIASERTPAEDAEDDDEGTPAIT